VGRDADPGRAGRETDPVRPGRETMPAAEAHRGTE
jgi:hypothetical protein